MDRFTFAISLSRDVTTASDVLFMPQQVIEAMLLANRCQDRIEWIVDRLVVPTLNRLSAEAQ